MSALHLKADILAQTTEVRLGPKVDIRRHPRCVCFEPQDRHGFHHITKRTHRAAPFLEMMKVVYKDRFFHQIYFQREGVS
jgi:hypothetical protein